MFLRTTMGSASLCIAAVILCSHVAQAAEPQKLAGHTGAARAVVYSPNSKLLFTAGEDGKLIVREWPGGKALREFAIPGQVITALAISADGKVLAAGTNAANLAKLALPDGAVPDGAMLEVWPGVPAAVTAVALSDDGRFVISGDAAGTTRLWDLTSKQIVRDFPGVAMPVTSVSFSTDDTIVCATAADGGLRAWNRDSGQLLGLYFSSPATGLAILEKEKQLLTSGNDGIVRRWGWPPEPRVNLAGHSDVVPSVALSSDGKLALSGGLDSQVMLWSVLEDKAVRPLAGASGKITSVALSGDGALAAAGTELGTLHFWNAADGTPRGTIVGHKSPITSLALDAKLGRIADTYGDGATRWWRVPEPTTAWTGHQSAITHIAASLDRRWVATCGSDKSIRVWDAATGQAKRVVESLPHAPERCCLSADGAWFAWSDATGSVRVEPTAIGNQSYVVQAHGGPVSGVALLEGGKLLVTAGADGSLKYWPLPLSSPKEIATLSSKITASFSLPNDRLLLGDDKGTVRLLDAAGEEESKLSLSKSPLTAVAMFRDGVTLIAADAQGLIHVARSDGTQGPMIVGGHQGPITAIAPHPSEPRFATSGEDGSIRIWRVPQVNKLERHERAIIGTAISADGRLGITAEASGALHRWNLAEGTHDAEIQIPGASLTAVRCSPLGGSAAGDAQGEVHFIADDAREVGSVLGTHDAAISQLAFHPTAPFVATASADGRVRVWNIQNVAAAVLARLEQPPQHILMSGDQAKLFAACDDGALIAIDLNTNAEAWKKSLAAPATCLAVSTDNSTLAVGLPGGEVELLRALDGTTTGTIGTGFNAVRSIAFRSGSGELATAHEDDVVRVWKIPTPPQLWSDHTGDVTLVAIAASGPLLASAGEDRTVRLWNTADGNPSWVLGHAHAVVGLGFSSDGTRLATMTVSAARVWNTVDGTLVREWKLASPGTTVAISADGKRLWTGHVSGKVSLWNVDDGASIRTLDAHSKRVTGLARAGSFIATAGADGLVKLWPADGDKPAWTATPALPLAALTTDIKETLLLGRDSKGQCYSFALADGTTKKTGEPGFRAAAISASGQLLSGVSQHGVEFQQIEAVPPATYTGLLERLPHGDKISSTLAILSDDSGIVAGDDKGRVGVWRRSLMAANRTTNSRITSLSYLEGRDRPTYVNRAGRIRHFDGSEVAAVSGVDDIIASAATRDGNRVAVLGGIKSLVVWDHKQNRVVASIPMPVAGTSVSLSGDGTRAAVVGEDGLARLWQLDPPRQLRRIGGGEKVVQALLSTAGDFVVVALEDGQLRRYAAANHAEVAAHGPGGTACAWWPNGERFLSGGADKYLRFHDRDYKPQGQIGPFDFPVQTIAVKPDGGQVLVGDQKNLYFLRGDNMQIERKQELPGGCLAIAFLAPGTSAVVACGDSKLRIIQVADGRVLEERACDHATSSLGAFSGPDGTTLLAAGDDHSALLLRGSLERMIVGHVGAVTSVAWAATGTMLVSGGVDKIVRQWNPVDGAQQRIFNGHADAVTSVAISHDGANVFAAGLDKTLRAWPLGDPNKQLYSVTLPAVARNIRLSLNSTRLYSAGDDNDVRMFDSVTGKLIEQMPLKAASSAVYLSADGKSLVSVGIDNVLRRATPSCTRLLQADAVKLHDLIALASDDAVAVSCEDKTIKQFDSQGTLIRALAGTSVATTSLSLGGDGKLLAAAGDANATQPYVWSWDPTDGKALPALTVPVNVAGVAVSPQGRLAVSTNDRRVLIYEQGQLLEELTVPAVATRLVYLDHGHIAASIGDQNVHIVKPSCELRFVGQQGAMTTSALSSDGKLLFTGGNEALLRVWNTTTGAQVSAATLAAGALQVRVSAKGDAVVASCADGKLLRWETAAFQKEQADPSTTTIQLPVAGRALSLSADGKRALVGCDDGWLRLYDLTSGKELERSGPSTAAIQSVVWSAESGRVIASSADKILARSRLGLIAASTVSKESILGLAVSPDGLRQATVDAAGNLVVSNLASGKQLAEQVLPTKVVYRLAWSPDGKELAIASGDGPLIMAVPAK
jgi:WD40 repeat protein